MAEGGGSVWKKNVEKGIANGLDQAGDLPPLHSILPLPQRILHDPLRIVIPVAERALRQMVVTVDAVGVRVDSDRVHGALQLWRFWKVEGQMKKELAEERALTRCEL